MKKIDMGQPQPQAGNAPSAPGRGRVVVSTNPVKNRVFIDIDGNEIDPRTKRIIRLEKDVH